MHSGARVGRGQQVGDLRLGEVVRHLLSLATS
jgi:hypothetical protein